MFSAPAADDDESARRCRPRHVFCFFMCYDVPPHMARFLWAMFFLSAEVIAFFAARQLAIAYGYGGRFSLVAHLAPLFFLAVANVPFITLQSGDWSARDSESNIDPVMRRISASLLFILIGMGIAFSVTVGTWWSDPISEHDYVYGPPPEHASPSARPHDTSSNPLNKMFGSPSRTPSHTPTASPDPAVRQREWQSNSDRRSLVGAVYFLSPMSACALVYTHYSLRSLSSVMY